MATENYGILVEQISVQVVNELLADSKESLRSVIGEIDRELTPHSFALPSEMAATLTVDLKQEKRTVHNVVAYWPGQTEEYVILGAHYDHLGLGQQNSLAPSRIGKIHPGADDNASGTVGVIEFARHAAAAGAYRRGLLFLCFTGEEEGLRTRADHYSVRTEPLGEFRAVISHSKPHH